MSCSKPVTVEEEAVEVSTASCKRKTVLDAQEKARVANDWKMTQLVLRETQRYWKDDEYTAYYWTGPSAPTRVEIWSTHNKAGLGHTQSCSDHNRVLMPKYQFGCPCQKKKQLGKQYDVRNEMLAKQMGCSITRFSQTEGKSIAKELKAEPFDHSYVLDYQTKRMYHGFTDAKTRQEMLDNPNTRIGQIEFEQAVERNKRNNTLKMIDGRDEEAIKKASDESHAAIIKGLEAEYNKATPIALEQLMAEQLQLQEQQTPLITSAPLVVVATPLNEMD